MDFIKEELLEKRRWRWTNELLKLGSQRMFSKFGGDGCNTIATLSLLAIFVWAAIGGVGMAVMATKVGIASFVIAFIVFFMVLISILSTLIMSVVNAEKPSS